MTLTRSRVQFPAHAIPFCSSAVIVRDRSRSAPPCAGGRCPARRPIVARRPPPMPAGAAQREAALSRPPQRCGQLASETGHSSPFCLFPAIAPKESDRWGAKESPAALGLARTHRRSSGALVPSFHLKFDACPLFQSVEVETLKAAAVEEYFLALGSADKPETTVTDNSLDSPLHGHLGKRMAIFALDRERRPAREVTTRTHWRNRTTTGGHCQRPNCTKPVWIGIEESRRQEVRRDGKSTLI